MKGEEYSSTRSIIAFGDREFFMHEFDQKIILLNFQFFLFMKF